MIGSIQQADFPDNFVSNWPIFILSLHIFLLEPYTLGPYTADVASVPSPPLNRTAKSPASSVKFAPSVDTFEGTYLHAHYQSDSDSSSVNPDNRYVQNGFSDCDKKDDSPINTPLPVSFLQFNVIFIVITMRFLYPVRFVCFRYLG